MSLEEELPRLLAAWLPEQRWFTAKGRTIGSIAVTSSTPLITDGDPLLDLVLVSVTFDDSQERQIYQLLVARGEQPRGELEHVMFGSVDDSVAYDGLWDTRVTDWLLEAVRSGHVADDVRFVAEPDAKIAEGAVGRVLGMEQSNTSVSWGEQSILKIFRRIEPGLNPDLEMHRALRSVGSHEVASLQGAVEGVLDGAPVTLGMLKDFAANSADGWSMALASVRDLLAEADLRADEVGGDFAAEASRLGETIGVVHAQLREALGVSERERLDLVIGWNERLETVAREVAELGPYVEAIRATYDAVGAVGGTIATQRVHGNLHLGQSLRTPYGWLILDFEGEPAASLAERVRPDVALRDVAGMLRSFDYAAFHSLSSDPEPDKQLTWRATEWAERNRSAFCDGYTLRAGIDPRDNAALLRAFELDKAIHDMVLVTHRPNSPAWGLSEIKKFLTKQLHSAGS